MADEARIKKALALLDAVEAFDKRDPDDFPGPQDRDLEAIWQDGITYGMDRLAACLDVTDWDRDGGSESVEGDVSHEIGSIMRKVAERRVLANGGTVGADGFDAAVDAEIDLMAGR